MRISSVKRSATVAWGASSEHASLLAAGTVAGAISESFDTTAHLELFSLDLATTGELRPLGSVKTIERFHQLAWSPCGVHDRSLPAGLLAGGAVDGSIKVFNPALMIELDSAADPLVACVEQHAGGVRGLQFNPEASQLLASGAADSEVYIIDLCRPETPSVYSPAPGAKGHGGADVACVAWNRKVTHILASTAYNGSSVVWDLKLKKPVITFSNNRGTRHSVVEWNPEVATQVLIASEDDSNPVLQLWDLRNAFAPVKELAGHQKGILTASWCPNDSSLLLSAGKDNRTLCWDPNAGELLCELPPAANWTFDVQWSPRIPALLSSCSFDGEVTIHSLQDASAAAPGGGGAKRSMHAPKWLRRPCGASFGFGGKLLVHNGGLGTRVALETVSDASVIKRADALQNAVNSGAMGAFCEQKASTAPNEKDKAEWRLMQVLSSLQQREELCSYLNVAQPGGTEAFEGLAIDEADCAATRATNTIHYLAARAKNCATDHTPVKCEH